MSRPVAIPLISPIGARYESLTVDSKLVNGFVEKGVREGEAHVYKRPGFEVVRAEAAGVGRGLWNWKNNLYSVWGGEVRKNGVLLSGSVNSTGRYSFVASVGASPLLVMTNGTHAYTIDPTDTLTDITASISAVVGSSWLPYITYLDGYFLLITADSRLWNSSADNPSSWNVSEYILARIDSDDPVAFTKHLAYATVIKQFYTEFFYDAGTGTVGQTPLAAVPGAKINYGCIDGRTVCECGGDLMWIGRTREGGATAILLSSVKAQPVSTPQIERLLQAGDYSGNVYSWSAKVDGHRFYGVTIVNSNLTLVFDLTSQLWYQWTDPAGNYLPYSSAMVGGDNRILFQHESNGKLYHLNILTFGDDGSVFPVIIATPNYDGGTRLWKTIAKVFLAGDQVNGSNVTFEYSDDDYQTWRIHGTFDMGSEDPLLADLGAFKKRAFRFTHASNTPFRIRQLEAFLDVGGS